MILAALFVIGLLFTCAMLGIVSIILLAALLARKDE